MGRLVEGFWRWMVGYEGLEDVVSKRGNEK